MSITDITTRRLTKKLNKTIILIGGSTATCHFFRTTINEHGKFNIWTMTKIKNVNR